MPNADLNIPPSLTSNLGISELDDFFYSKLIIRIIRRAGMST